MTKTNKPKRSYERGENKSLLMTFSLRPDRVEWIKAEAESRNISRSDIVRELIDQARKQAERESIGMS